MTRQYPILGRRRQLQGPVTLNEASDFIGGRGEKVLVQAALNAALVAQLAALQRTRPATVNGCVPWGMYYAPASLPA